MSLDALLEQGAPAWLRQGGAGWRAGTLDRAGLYEAVEHLAAAPGFAAVSQTAAREVLAFLTETPMALRVVRDMPMYLLLVCCMHLHHRRDAADPRSGITLARLRELYTRGGTRRYAADTHLRDMLAWARLRGLLQPAAAAAADRRVRRFEPGPPMVTMFQRWLRAFTRSGVVALPPALLDGDLPRAELMHEVLSDRVAAYAEDGFTPTERYPLVQQFMQRRHGYHVFLALLEAQGGMAPPLSVSALATRFQVARGTIRNALALAQEAGLLQAAGDGSRLQPTPAFDGFARHWMALELTWMNGVIRAAAARLSP